MSLLYDSHIMEYIIKDNPYSTKEIHHCYTNYIYIYIEGEITIFSVVENRIVSMYTCTQSHCIYVNQCVVFKTSDAESRSPLDA